MARKPGDETKLIEWFQAHPDKPVSIHRLASILNTDAKNLSRRVRALRPKGWTILSNNDLPGKLKPGWYMFPSGQKQGVNREKKISTRLRAEILQRDQYICQTCGLAAGDSDPETGRRVILQVHHVDDTLTGPALNSPANLRTRCRTCNEGSRHFDAPPPDFMKIKGFVRAASVDVRRQVYDYLREQFEPKRKS